MERGKRKGRTERASKAVRHAAEEPQVVERTPRRFGRGWEPVHEVDDGTVSSRIEGEPEGMCEVLERSFTDSSLEASCCGDTSDAERR